MQIDKGVSGFTEEEKKLVSDYKKTRPTFDNFNTKKKWGNSAEETPAEKQKRFNELRRFHMSITEERAGLKHAILLGVGVLILKKSGMIEKFASLDRTSKMLIFGLLGLRVYMKVGAPRIINDYHNAPRFTVPFFGSTIELVVNALPDLCTYMLKCSERFNFENSEDTMIGPARQIVIDNEIDRRYILKDNWGNFTKNNPKERFGTFEWGLTELLGRGIFVTDEEEWRDHRKIASHMFSVNGLRTQMEKVFLEHALRLRELLEEEKDSGRVMDWQEIMQGFTFDTICEIAFGHSPNAAESSFRGVKPKFLTAFDGMQQIASERMIRVWFEWLRWLNVGEEAKHTKHTKVVNEYVNAIIRDRRASGDFATRNDLLSLYIKHARETNSPHLESTEYLRDVIVNFMVAGRDTTSCTMTTMVRYLTSNPDTMAKMREEFSKTVGDDVPDWENMRESQFTTAVINESLRMLPPVAMDFRVARQDDVLPSGTIVPATCKVGISNISIARNPALFSDPYTWRPERWYVSENKVRARPDEYTFPVFWAGPRLCLGKDMARFELAILAWAMATADFDLEILLPDPEKVTYQNGLVIFLKNLDHLGDGVERGAPMRVVSRTDV